MPDSRFTIRSNSALFRFADLFFPFGTLALCAFQVARWALQ